MKDLRGLPHWPSQTQRLFEAQNLVGTGIGLEVQNLLGTGIRGAERASNGVLRGTNNRRTQIQGVAQIIGGRKFVVHIMKKTKTCAEHLMERLSPPLLQESEARSMFQMAFGEMDQDGSKSIDKAEFLAFYEEVIYHPMNFIGLETILVSWSMR